MAGRYHFLLRPRWLGLHLLTVALVVTMVLLGRWQLDVSNAKHFSLQNFGYALQWWAFSLFVIVFWARVVRDKVRGATPAEPQQRPQEPVTYRRYVPPTAPVVHDDPELAAYNDYLAQLAHKDSGRTDLAQKDATDD